MKILGWTLLLLSAMLMVMCSNSGPETRAFVMSPAGMWAWLVWLALLIGGSGLVYGSANRPKR